MVSYGLCQKFFQFKKIEMSVRVELTSTDSADRPATILIATLIQGTSVN